MMIRSQKKHIRYKQQQIHGNITIIRKSNRCCWCMRFIVSFDTILLTIFRKLASYPHHCDSFFHTKSIKKPSEPFDICVCAFVFIGLAACIIVIYFISLFNAIYEFTKFIKERRDDNFYFIQAKHTK